MIAHFSISAILLLLTWFFWRASVHRITNDQLHELHGFERSPWPGVTYVGASILYGVAFFASLIWWFVAAVKSIVV